MSAYGASRYSLRSSRSSVVYVNLRQVYGPLIALAAVPGRVDPPVTSTLRVRRPDVRAVAGRRRVVLVSAVALMECPPPIRGYTSSWPAPRF